MHKVPNLQCFSALMFNLWNVKMHNIMTVCVCVFITEAFHTLMSGNCCHVKVYICYYGEHRDHLPMILKESACI